LTKFSGLSKFAGNGNKGHADFAGMANDLFDEALLVRVAAVGTATLSDAMDRLLIPGVTSGLRRRSGKGRAVGYAETMSAETGELGKYNEADFSVFSVFSEVHRHGMLVISLGGTETSTLGGLAGLLLRARGASGAVIDGACRDVDQLVEEGITVASRHVTPRSGRGRMRVLARDKPVVCGGVTIHPGDIIVVDDTGVVAIPRASVNEVMEIAEAIETHDAAVEKRIREHMTKAS
jgi:regulator of RNase E activity RraA